jgi:hypothetical protein
MYGRYLPRLRSEEELSLTVLKINGDAVGKFETNFVVLDSGNKYVEGTVVDDVLLLIS